MEVVEAFVVVIGFIYIFSTVFYDIACVIKHMKK